MDGERHSAGWRPPPQTVVPASFRACRSLCPLYAAAGYRLIEPRVKPLAVLLPADLGVAPEVGKRPAEARPDGE